MSSEDLGSISRCLDLLKRGDHDAAQVIYQRYLHRLSALALWKLRAAPRRAADEEDVALSALDSFFRRAEAGGFPRLEDRDDLWQVLLPVTVRKAIDLIQRERRPSRGAGRVGRLEDLEASDLEALRDAEPGPELATQFAEECRRLLDHLGDETLRSVAIWKLEGYTNGEIAERLGCVTKTVDRKVRAIRRLWAGEVPGG